MLELNPFESSTSACLFDWAVDGSVLRGQTHSDFEMRVRKSPLTGILDRAVPHIRKRLQNWVSDMESKMSTVSCAVDLNVEGGDAAGSITCHAKSQMSMSEMEADCSSKDEIACRNCMLKYCVLNHEFCPTCGSSTAITKKYYERII